MRGRFRRWLLSRSLVSLGASRSERRKLMPCCIANHIRPKGTRTIPAEVKFMGKDWRQYKKADWGNDVYTLYL